MTMSISLSIFFCSLLVLTTSAYQCWTPWNNLPTPYVGQCTICATESIVLFGGRNPKGITTTALAISAMNPGSYSELPATMPIASIGPSFCTISGRVGFVSAQGGPAPASTTNSMDYNLYYATFTSTNAESSLDSAAVTSTGWSSAGIGFFKRARAGITAIRKENSSHIHVFFFGGVADGDYVNNVEWYDAGTGLWNDCGFMPHDNRFVTSCDCKTAVNGIFITLICFECAPTQGIVGLAHIMTFDTEQLEFVGPIVMFDFGWYFLTLSVAPMEHYVLMLSNDQKHTNPTLYYFDTQLMQVSNVTTAYIYEVRSGGALFTITYRAFYAGGQFLNGSLSSDVYEVPAFPEQFVTPDNTNYTYEPGQLISLSLSNCQPGLTVRLAETNICDRPAAGSKDTLCTPLPGGNGKAVLNTTEYFYSGAYLCISLGICTTNVSARVVEPYYDFEHCMFNMFCWDEATQTCFQYIDGPSSKKSFTLVNSQVINIGVLPPVQPKENPVIKFLTSSGGILTIAAVALVCVTATATVVWRVLRPRDEEDYIDEGSSHPLDQHGKYKILCKLGQGGFGTVYLVARKSDGERFAMKYIVCADDEERNYAMKEFELLRSSQGHPNMIKLHEMFMNWGSKDDFALALSIQNKQETETKKKSKNADQVAPLLQIAPRYVCIVMDYCPEGDLSRFILRIRQAGMDVPEEMILNVVVRQCCSLLAHLHTLTPPIVHRDIKPENILLRSNGEEVVLTDFGLAQQVEKSYMTTRAGSLHYVAPECWKRHYTTAVDMWAVGCIAYGMCTGRITASTARVMFSDARDKNFERDVRHDLRNYSSQLRGIVLGLLQTNPTKRLTSSQVISMLDSKYGAPQPTKEAITIEKINPET